MLQKCILGAQNCFFEKQKMRPLTKTWISERNFEESYLSEFLRYGLRKKCVRKPLMCTFQKSTCWVPQNILRAASKGFVLNLHFLVSSNEMMPPDFSEWWGYTYRCSKGRYYEVENMTTWYFGGCLIIHIDFWVVKFIF